MIKRVLVTGAAGFIGKHAVAHFLNQGCEVVGIDNLNDFTYPADIKYDRLESIGLEVSGLKEGEQFAQTNNGLFTFHEVDVTDSATVQAMIIDGDFDLIVNLAGMTSVSASSLSPQIFFSTNVDGFINVLEGVRILSPTSRPKLLFASSAAIYGNVGDHSLDENDKNLMHPASIYGATKCMIESAAETYARLYGIGSVALRFFNIYGPYERPDTFINDITRALISKQPLYCYDGKDGGHDFMYIDDCIKAVDAIAESEVSDDGSFEVVNIGTQNPISGARLIEILEKISGKKLNKILQERPAGEIFSLSANTQKFQEMFKVKPEISIEEGLKRFYEWYKPYYENGVAGDITN